MFTTKRIEDIDISKVTFQLPKKFDTTTFFNMKYNGKGVVIQLPRLPVIFGGVSDYQAKDGAETQYSFSLGLEHYPEVFQKLSAIEETFKNFLCEEVWPAIGKKQISREVLDQMSGVYDLIKYTKKEKEAGTKEQPFLTCKLKINKNGDFEFNNVFLMNLDNEIEEENIVLNPSCIGEYIFGGTEVATIMNIYGWRGTGGQGLVTKPKMLRIWNGDAGGAVFLDEDETAGESAGETASESAEVPETVEEPQVTKKRGRKAKNTE